MVRVLIGLVIFIVSVLGFEALAVRRGVDTRDSEDWILHSKHGI